MTRKTWLSLVLTLSATALCASPAAAKPNFSGAWKIILDKSDYGPVPMPTKLEQVIEHTEPDLKVKQTQASQQGEVTVDLVYNTEGKETTNQLRGTPMKTVAKWDGDALILEGKVNFQGNEITITDRWAMAEDGKTYTVTRKLVTPQGDVEMKQVMEKQ